MSAHRHAAALSRIQADAEALALQLRALAAEAAGTEYSVRRASYWFDRAARDYADNLNRHADLIESAACCANRDAEAHAEDLATAEQVEFECADDAEYERANPQPMKEAA